jgi:hypothetical protein
MSFVLTIKKIIPESLYVFFKTVKYLIIDTLLLSIIKTWSLKDKGEEFNKLFNKLLTLLKIKPSDLKLIRLGGVGDGGYIVPTIIKKTDILISVGSDKKIKFEEDFLKINKNSNVYIFEKDKQKINKKKLKKIKIINAKISSYQNLKNLSLNNFIKKIKNYKKKIFSFQIDCEGCEYLIIANLDQKILSKTIVIVIEVHFNELIKSSAGLNIVNEFLEKILLTHDIIHIHPNNSLENYFINGLSFPRNCEITFVKKKYFKFNKNNEITIPNKLDCKNHNKRDVKLPEFLYKY